MSAYSMDLRERIVAALEAGEPQVAVSRRFGVCTKTVQRYGTRAQAGQLAPRPLPGRASRVSQEQQEALAALVQEDPDRTLAQMSQVWQERSGQHLPTSTLHDALKRLNARFKKTRLAKEQDEQARRQFQHDIECVPLECVPLDKMVFLDECGFSLNLHRLYGWLIGGGRLFERVPFQKGQNRSVVGAYGWPGAANPTGLWALWQRVGAWNARLFELFVSEALLPHLPQGSVLVLDNATIHKSQALKTLVEEAGCSLLFLPTYSPDLNPLEMVWSWIKEQVRDMAPRDDEQRRQNIHGLSQTLPPQHAKGWFHKCGLC